MSSLKAPNLAIVLGGMHHGGGEPDEHDEEMDGEDGDTEQAMHDASEAAIEAVHSKDAAAFAQAVGAICKLHYEQMEGEEEEEEPEAEK